MAVLYSIFEMLEKGMPRTTGVSCLLASFADRKVTTSGPYSTPKKNRSVAPSGMTSNSFGVPKRTVMLAVFGLSYALFAAFIAAVSFPDDWL